jgi:Protein of unknown function (DUF1579)
MKMKSWVAAALLTAFVGAIPVVMADDKVTEKKAPDQKAMMDAWMKAMTPGEGHKKLEPFVGSFDVKVTSWMAPGAPPAESSGSAEDRWVLGGRYVQEMFDGQFMGQPFSGIGYTGYDNIKKAFVSTWMDNMSTAIMMTKGSMEGNTMTSSGTMDDPMSGKSQTMNNKVTVLDKDHHTMEMWGPGPDGKAFKMMEISYARKK